MGDIFCRYCGDLLESIIDNKHVCTKKRARWNMAKFGRKKKDGEILVRI